MANMCGADGGPSARSLACHSSLAPSDLCQSVQIALYRMLLRGYHWVVQFVMWLSLGGAVCHAVIIGWRSLSRGYHGVAQFVT